ncbi:hypothetical protein [Peribacillus butanolivorans]
MVKPCVIARECTKDIRLSAFILRNISEIAKTIKRTELYEGLHPKNPPPHEA